MQVELHFIKKDFLGKPIGILSGIYDKYDDTPKWRKISGSHNLPCQIDSRKIRSKFIECQIGSSICLQSIDMKYCNCGKKDCSYNEEFKRIITDFVNNKNNNKMSKETPKLTLLKQEDISGEVTYNVKINGFTEFQSEELEKSKMQFEYFSKRLKEGYPKFEILESVG